MAADGKATEFRITEKLAEHLLGAFSMLFLPFVRRPSCSYFWDNYVSLTLVSAVGISLAMVFYKVLSEDVSVFQGVAARSLFGSVVFVLACWQQGISFFEPREKVRLFIARGIAGGICNSCLFASTSLLPLSDAAFMANSFPVVTAVFSWMLGMERLGLSAWFGVLGTIVGNVLVAQPSFLFGGQTDWDTKRLLGIVTAIAANFFLAAISILLRYIGKGVNSMVPTAYMHVGTVVVTLPFLASGVPQPVNTEHSILVLISYVAVCATGVLSQLVKSRAFQVGPPAKTTTLLMTHMLLSALIGVIFFSESISLLSAVGAVVLVVSVILVTLPDANKSEMGQHYEELPMDEEANENLQGDNEIS